MLLPLLSGSPPSAPCGPTTGDRLRQNLSLFVERETAFKTEVLPQGIFLVQTTVFTATAGPLPDKGPESGVHHSPWELARSWRALDLRMATNVPKLT